MRYRNFFVDYSNSTRTASPRWFVSKFRLDLSHLKTCWCLSPVMNQKSTTDKPRKWVLKPSLLIWISQSHLFLHKSLIVPRSDVPQGSSIRPRPVYSEFMMTLLSVRLTVCRRHVAKIHSSAYACALDNCRNRAFGSKADLLRHRREIHSQNGGQTLQKFRCPIPSCRRHRQGFPRESNMFGHYQRMHARSMDKSARREHLSLTLDQGNNLDEDNSDREPSVRISESSSSEVQSPGRDHTSSSQKLRDELEAMSQEFDSQMETLKREYKTKSETLQRAIDLLEEGWMRKRRVAR